MSENQELLSLLNALLEAERAGVQTMDHISGYDPSLEMRDTYKRIKKDEAWSCAGLQAAILREGGKPTGKTGDFADKVQEQTSLFEKFQLLNKGQGWVVRKIEQCLTYPMERATRSFLLEMKGRHEQNIQYMEQLLDEK